jgi:hypothetical protein
MLLPCRIWLDAITQGPRTKIEIRRQLFEVDDGSHVWMVTLVRRVGDPPVTIDRTSDQRHRCLLALSFFALKYRACRFLSNRAALLLSQDQA